jgi:hypothetical protein
MPAVYALSKGSESLPEVPWVMGDPTSSYKWQVSVAGGKKKKRGMRAKPEKLDKALIKIYLKGKKVPFKLNLFRKGIQEDFNPITITSNVLRGLHYVKLKGIKRIRMGQDFVYEGEQYSALIEIMKDMTLDIDDIKDIRIHGTLKPSIETKVRIQKVHKKGAPSVTIGIYDRIQKERVNKLIGYLKKHLPVDKIEY